MLKAASSQPIGLVGFGLMGQGIATCLLSRGMSVRVYDSQRRTYTRGQANVEAALAELVRRRLLKSAVRKSWRERLLCVSSFDDFAPCRLVIESVPEDLELKQQLFRELEVIVGPRGAKSGEVEIKRRATGERETMTADAAINKLVASIGRGG